MKSVSHSDTTALLENNYSLQIIERGFAEQFYAPHRMGPAPNCFKIYTRTAYSETYRMVPLPTRLFSHWSLPLIYRRSYSSCPFKYSNYVIMFNDDIYVGLLFLLISPIGEDFHPRHTSSYSNCFYLTRVTAYQRLTEPYMLMRRRSWWESRSFAIFTNSNVYAHVFTNSFRERKRYL